MSPLNHHVRNASAAVFTSIFLCAAMVPAAHAAKPIVGTLTCKGKGTVGMILGSKESLRCTYKPANGGQVEHYRATITKIGLDIGVKGSSTLIWSVLGSTDFAHGALVGDYTGVSAEAAVAIGAGANALVGGSNNAVVLQPLSVQGQTGVNIAIGVSQLQLR
jgi:hypothetical protein